jgi:hypothetical protein
MKNCWQQRYENICIKKIQDENETMFYVVIQMRHIKPQIGH